MTKLLLIAVGFLLAWWILKAYKKSLRSTSMRHRKTAAEDMVRCARCGVHLPRSESKADNGQFFCCEEHRRLDR
jgi:uncharacterized protein